MGKNLNKNIFKSLKFRQHGESSSDPNTILVARHDPSIFESLYK